MQLFNISTVAITIIIVFGTAESQQNEILRCVDTGEKCAINATCTFHCRYSCCKKLKKDIYGSIIYTSESSVCRSALHDLRISLYNSTKREVTIKRYQQDNCSLESSVKHGFSSSDYKNETCDVFKFVSPLISEDILDVVSMHSNYLYRQNENHNQVCITASNAIDQKVSFGIYSDWDDSNCGTDKEARGMENGNEFKNVWSKKPLSPGFQCIPTQTDLSIITSIAFRKDASFLPEHLTITVNKCENVTLTMNEIQEKLDYETEWRKEDVLLQNYTTRTKLSLFNVHESSSGIYSLTYQNSDIEESGFVQLIVRACPSGKFGNNCSMSCLPCLNGGICHDITGECLCAPGFNGSSCETACQPGYVGKMCSIRCIGQSHGEEDMCRGLLICLPSPYGCSCASGFAGLHCDEVCPGGFYGAGCLQKHKHVQRKEENCSRFSDFCECQKGWHGIYCNESYPVLNDPPSIIHVTKNSITLSFTKWKNSTDKGTGIPTYYEVVFKEMGDYNWKLGHNVSEESVIQPYQVQIHNLKPATQYTIGVIVVDESENKQETGIKTVNATTHCDSPSMPPSDVKLSSANQHIYVRWKIPSKENWDSCNIDILIRAKEISTNRDEECIKNDNVSCSFFSAPLDTWVVEVCASTGEKENCAEPKNITAKGPAYTSPVELEIIKKETSLSLSWASPRFSSKLSHYVIKYEDMDTNISESITIQTQDAICEENKGNFNCYTIQNLKPGHTYAFEIIAIIKYVNEGSVIKSFIVHMEKNTDVLPVILGVCISFLVFCMIILIHFLWRRKKLKSSLKVKFLPYSSDNEFAACNEALDEMEIIETESMCEEISNVIHIEELPGYVKQSLQNAKIRKEFMSVPTGQIYPCSFAKLGENKPKNRYGNILPYDHSRVILDTINCDAFSNYIHASYIHGYNKVKKYIATQGPLLNTVNDFWRMVWNEGSCKILMITNFIENGKSKCEKYWTETYSMYGDIEVAFKDSQSYADFIIRTFYISKDKNPREVKQFHFTTWPDHGAPTNCTPFIRYLKKTRSYKPDSDASVIIHCSAGIGRTGATILLDSMMDMGHHEKKVDLVNQLCSMRKQRMNMVENYDQYVFVYNALVENLCFEDTCISYSNVKEEIERIKGIDQATGMTFIEKQFKALDSLNIELMSKDVQGAYQMENQSKNRSMLILPPDQGRPFLSRDSSSSDYINAVYVDNFTTKNAYIATQYPLPETVSDFWNMVYVQKSKIIVVLQEMDYSIEETPQLWLLEDIKTFGEFEIICQSIATDNEMTVVNITLSTIEETNKEPIPINIIVLKNWATDKSLPANTSVILSAISKIHSLNSEPKSTVTAVCFDGATACGIFCASLYISDQIKAENEVDIFHTVKCIRTNRPQFIVNLAQYEFLYEIVSAYSDTPEV